MWQLESIIENENGVAVTMFTQSDGHTRKWWPGEFRLVHRVIFGSDLHLELVCMNTGTTPFRFEEALHTYNRIANIQDARILGLDVGRLVPGSPADLVLFDPDMPWRIDTERFRSKSKNAPFDGRPVQGRAEHTIVDGRTIFAREGGV